MSGRLCDGVASGSFNASDQLGHPYTDELASFVVESELRVR